MLRIAGVGLDAIAAQFKGAHRDAVWRHVINHLTEADKAAYLADIPLSEMLARAADEGVSLLDFFKIVRSTLMKQFQLAASVNDRRAVAALAGRLNEVLTSIGSVTGEMLRLGPANVTNNLTVLINSPGFRDLQSMLISKLAGHPEALSAVVEGLEELEARALSEFAPPLTLEATTMEGIHAGP
jgi:hypothetical protein